MAALVQRDANGNIVSAGPGVTPIGNNGAARAPAVGTVTNPDGGVTTTVQNPDGSISSTTTYASGASKGISTTKTYTTDPQSGATSVATTNSTGSDHEVQTYNPDGSYTSSNDGGKTYSQFNANGTSVGNYHADGTPESASDVAKGNSTAGGDLIGPAFGFNNTNPFSQLNHLSEEAVTGAAKSGDIPDSPNALGAIVDAGKAAANAVTNATTPGGSGSGSSDIVDAVNKVAAEAQGYAGTEQQFQLTGLDNALGAYAPANAGYASMYGPGGTQTTAGQGEQAFSDQAGNLLAPTAQSGVLAQAGGYLGGTSPGMSALSQVAPQLGGPTLSGQSYGQYASQLAAPSTGTNYFDSTAGQYGTNALQQSAAGLNAQYAAPTNLQSNLGTLANETNAPTQSSQTFGANQSTLAAPGALENFASSDLAGTNAYYANLQKLQAAQTDASYNQKGGFNSGADLNAQAVGNATLAAQQYQQEAALQQQAESDALTRTGQSQTAAGQVDQAQQTAATNTGNLLSTADAQQLAATNAQAALAQNTASTNLGYLQGGQTAANAVSGQQLAQTQAGIGLAQGTDATNLAQNLGYVNAANSAGAGQTAQYSAYGQLAQGADAATQAQYMNYLNSANTAQTDTLNRQQTGVADATALGQAQAGNTLTAYGQAGNQYASMIDASLGAQQNAAQLQAQQNQNAAANQLGYAGLAVKGLTALL